jgi:hypothetical protein
MANALYVELPAWLAVIEQTPALRSTARSSTVVQIRGVFEAKVTGRRELASAAIGNGETPRI